MIPCMGKAARKKHAATPKGPRPAAYVRRPFAGLAGEADWVALTEILPAATATVALKAGVAPADGPAVVTIATVLPMAWPALRRADGAVLVATQGGGSTGDASRDLGSAIVAALAAAPGTPLAQVPLATDDSPRVQDLVEGDAAFAVTVHEGYDFWVEGQDLDADAQESLARANDSVIPTVKMSGAPAAYWCLLGNRPHIRLVLAEDEDDATNALARLAAAGTATLGEGTRLLGAFRAAGLLIPVWELTAGTTAADYEEGISAFTSRYAAALGGAPLTAAERGARSGLISRQVTLR